MFKSAVSIVVEAQKSNEPNLVCNFLFIKEKYYLTHAIQGSLTDSKINDNINIEK